MKKEKYLYKFFKRYYSVFLISLLVFTYLFISSNLELIKTSAIFISFFVFLFFVINNKSNLLHIFFQLGILAFSTFMIYKSLNITILSIVFMSCVNPSRAKNSVCKGTRSDPEHTSAITVNRLSDGGQSISI